MGIYFNYKKVYNLLMMTDLLKPTFDWIRDDLNSNPFRFIAELLAWAISIGCSITMAVTVPNPPLLALYPVWIAAGIGCIPINNHLQMWIKV